jgi:hypothetical protein
MEADFPRNEGRNDNRITFRGIKLPHFIPGAVTLSIRPSDSTVISGDHKGPRRTGPDSRIRKPSHSCKSEYKPNDAETFKGIKIVNALWIDLKMKAKLPARQVMMVCPAEPVVVETDGTKIGGSQGI